jgi:hypothetical protein
LKDGAAGTIRTGRLSRPPSAQPMSRARPTQHGGEPSEINLPVLRRVVRDCILARLVLGDPGPKGERLADLADAALLDHGLLAQGIGAPMAQSWADVRQADRPATACRPEG